jgi:hypothetical protein
MIVKKQKPLVFVNRCAAEYEEWQLEQAILWQSQTRPVVRVKHVYMHGNYPAISIHGDKFHIHRLILSWHYKRSLKREEYAHHKDKNKMNARLSNLELMSESAHQSHHNKGKKVSAVTRKRLTEANKRNWATKWKHRRAYETPELLK